MEFEEVAAHFGYTLGGGALPVKEVPIYRKAPRRVEAGARHRDADAVRISSRQYQKLVAKIEGSLRSGF